MLILPVAQTDGSKFYKKPWLLQNKLSNSIFIIGISTETRLLSKREAQ